MDPALATGLVRSALDEFGYLYPIDLFTSGWNMDGDERRKKDGVKRDERTVCGHGTDENFVFTTGPLAFWKYL